MLKLTLPDGSTKQLPDKSTGMQLAESIGRTLAKDALAIEIDGELRDLNSTIEKDAKVKILTFDDEAGRDVFEHSASHLMTQAILRLFKGQNVGLGVGFPVKEGFYQDYDVQGLDAYSVEKIEKEMQKIVDEKRSITHKEISKKEAFAFYKNDSYKTELIHDVPGDTVTMYVQGEFENLCKGPHVPNTSYLKAFKLTSVTGAYWRGDSKNKQLTRVYGVAFPSEKLLKEHLALLEELKKRDHRRLGKQMDLFTFSELVGSGLPLYTPKGTILWKELTGFSEELQMKAGFERVWIPHITKTELYKKSGHWDKFGNELFLVKSQETSDEFVMKPMNCPHHTQIYASRKRSYRDLPIRYMETTTCYRDEKSGELSGLSRVRSLTQDDAHVFCTMAHVENEFELIMNMIKQMYSKLKLSFKCRLSFWDPKNPEKYLGSAKDWENAQTILEKIAKKLKLDYFIEEGEAAFYGPKIDVMVTDAFGREWQCATEQLDFNMPARFGLTYTDADNTEKTPVMIHKALLGSVDRFLSVYIEHTGGKFPLWLSPEQARVLPVSDKFIDSARKLVDEMKQHKIRAVLDTTSETISKKVRNAQLDQVNYILVFGDKELSGELSVRTRENKVFAAKKDQFIRDVLEEIAERR